MEDEPEKWEQQTWAVPCEFGHVIQVQRKGEKWYLMLGYIPVEVPANVGEQIAKIAIEAWKRGDLD